MSTPEDEIKDLREKNNELVQKVQYWKMTAAQRENEKLELMKEINELRLKLSRIRSGGAAQARKLDAALQSASEEALSHLVQASGAVARTIELAKTYMRDRQELDDSSPRWSNISGTPNNERVHRVPPMMIGGQSIQPVVSLSRAIFNTSNPRTGSRSPNQSLNRSGTERAVPMHMLQDVYIPLTRIDAALQPGNNMDTDTEQNNIEDSTEDLGLEDSHERSIDESQDITEEFEESRRLDAVTEDLEPEDEIETPPRSRLDNPLEGPSWLLDIPTNNKSIATRPRSNLEPDSTTELEEAATPPAPSNDDAEKENAPLGATFSPTLRRRKRTVSPPSPLSPAPPAPAANHARAHPRRLSTSGRVLKVLVAKMRLDDCGDGDGDVSPPKRAMQASPARKRESRDSPNRRSRESRDSPGRRSREKQESPQKRPVRFDAPSPNGSTDTRVVVSEVIPETQCGGGSGGGGGGDGRVRSHGGGSRDSDARSSASCDSDAGDREETRTRRPRKAITYKEKPLNRKMRR